MDMNIKKIKEIFKEKKNFLKEKRSGIRPGFVWEMALLSGFVLILLSFAFGFYLFMQVNNESSAAESAVVTQSSTSKNLDRLQKTLQNFSDKQNKSAAILNAPSSVVDPSL